jgi:hypothetical protein
VWRERTGVQRIEEKMQRTRRRRRRRRGRGGEEREKRKRRVCELVRNSVVKPSIYRRMERKKKTMKEIKKEKEEKWNLSGR